MKSKSVYGVFNSRESAANAFDELKAAEFSNSDLKILFSPPSNSAENKINLKVLGMACGGLFGVLVGLLAGISLGSLILPGFSSVIMAGPESLALIGTGIGVSVGGIAGAILDTDVPKFGEPLTPRFNSGGFLIHADAANTSLANSALRILKKNHANKVSISSI